MKILITGGAGFIGSHLCERLLALGKRVICVDNFYSGNVSNIKELQKNPNFLLLNHDVNKPVVLKEKIDEIWNFASPASPTYYQKDPIFTFTTNVMGAKNMLDLALKHGAKFLQASTSEVYGDPIEHPQKETYFGNVNPIGLRACYDEGKRAVESLCMDYHRVHNINVKIVRIFNTYGPRMRIDDGRVVSNFIVQALKKEPITIYGNGSQTRSFCYIEDLIEGLVRLMQSDHCGPMNIGNPEEHTIKEIAEKINVLTHSRSPLKYLPLPKDDPTRRRPDITRAKEILGWSPNISLDEGLTRTIDFFKRALYE